MKIRKNDNPNWGIWCMNLCIGQMWVALSTTQEGIAPVGFTIAGVLFTIASLLELFTIEK